MNRYELLGQDAVAPEIQTSNVVRLAGLARGADAAKCSLDAPLSIVANVRDVENSSRVNYSSPPV
jgi:hypothetical protein